MLSYRLGALQLVLICINADALLFPNTDDYKHITNPAIVRLDSTVLAFAEARRSGHDADHIDLVMKRSVDFGVSWSEMDIRVHSGQYATALGNIVPIADSRGSGVFHLVYCVNNTFVFYTKSTDKGLSWIEPRNLTSMVKRPGWGWMATGPGHGILTSKGRLVVPFNTFFANSKVTTEVAVTGCASAYECSRYHPGQASLRADFTIVNPDDPDDVRLSGSRNLSLVDEDGVTPLPLPPTGLPWAVFAGDRSGVLYSDDAGETWSIGGQVVSRVGSSECSVAETPEAIGELLISFRVEDPDTFCRKFARSMDDGGSFQPFFEADGCVPDPKCQGSVLTLASGIMLSSGPGSKTGRTDVLIHKSVDSGQSFQSLLRFPVGDINTGYTDLVQLQEHSDKSGWAVGLLYGANEGVGYEIFNVSNTIAPLIGTAIQNQILV